jgi:hypothetical protein
MNVLKNEKMKGGYKCLFLQPISAKMVDKK